MSAPAARPAAVPASPDRGGAVLVHGPGGLPASLAAAVPPEGVEVRAAASLSAAALPADAPAVVVLDDALAVSEAGLSAVLRALPPGAVVLTAGREAELRAGASERVLMALPASAEGAGQALRAAFRHAAAGLAVARAEGELARARSELRELSEVGMALMTERDPDRLLGMIVAQARALTGSDACSLYLVEDEDEGPGQRLRFRLSQTASLPDLPFVSFTLPLDRSSLAGYAAVTGETVVVEDAYRIAADAPYSLNRSFDERFGYRTKSLLVVPMIDHQGTTVGVLQLINRKSGPAARIVDEEAAERWVLPYGDRELALVRSLAGQAAVSIENSLLYRQIEDLFESFVKAAVIAVDQRDPTTSGHSVRVATLTVDVAGVLERAGRGPYAGVTFTREQMKELRYAALLHDFGKVGVREEVLVKAKKLPPLLLERVSARFDLIRRTAEADHHRRRAETLEREGPSSPALEALGALGDEHARVLRELEEVAAVVRAANEPSILPEAAAGALEGIARMVFRGMEDHPTPYLTEDELRFLRIPKGSLNDHERLEIESHVEQTYRFLRQIPWTGDLRNVAELAYGHHEKLNGRGYPRGVAAPEIPVQTRIMTVVDIFDALTASDRPYKRALPADRALDILRMEARDGLLDADLVEILVESGLYRRVLDVDWREL